MKVRIIQLLCAQRHCIIARPYESATGEADPAKLEELKNTVRDLRQNLGLDHWCGICRTTDLTYEDAPTRFETMAEAMPHLLASEKAQLETRRFLDASKG